MNVDAGTYDIFSRAIYHTLKKENKGISYIDIVNGIKKCFKEAKTILGKDAWNQPPDHNIFFSLVFFACSYPNFNFTGSHLIPFSWK
jgi:hypothetical protein